MQKRPFCIHTHQNQRYFAPETEVLEIRLEGMIATSEIVDGIPEPEEIPGIGF